MAYDLQEQDQLDAFKASVNKVVQDKFGAKFGELYKEIAAVK